MHLPCLIALHFVVVLRGQGWLEGPEIRLCMRQHKQLHHSVAHLGQPHDGTWGVAPVQWMRTEEGSQLARLKDKREVTRTRPGEAAFAYLDVR